MYILLCCVTYFALSIERTWPDLHFTADYILYDYVTNNTLNATRHAFKQQDLGKHYEFGWLPANLREHLTIKSWGAKK